MKIAILCDVTPGSRLRFHRFSEELGASPISVGGGKKTCSVYDCTVEDVEYIYNTLSLLSLLKMCILS